MIKKFITAIIAASTMTVCLASCSSSMESDAEKVAKRAAAIGKSSV